MLHFYVYRIRFPRVLTRHDMTHDDCMRLACHMPVDVLNQDIEQWRDSAKHGDIYVLRQGEMSIIALDLEHKPERKLNTTLAVGGILEDSGSILLGLRDKADAAFPGLWCTPGGGSEQGEFVDQAMVREFKEEVGLTVAVLGDFTCYTEYFRSNGRRAMLIFKNVMSLSPLDEVKALDGFSQVRWFNREQIAKMAELGELTPSTAEAISKYRAWQSASKNL